MALKYEDLTYNFQNMSVAVETCSTEHVNGTLSYYRCFCAGLRNERFIRAKYHFCKKAASLEAEASAETMAQVGQVIAIVLGVCALLAICIMLYRRFKAQIRSAFAHLGMKQHFDTCTRMFCVCCQKMPSQKLDELPANSNIAGRPTSRCGRCCYGDTFLGIMEFICDCDCFRARRTPKYMVPIVGRARSKGHTASSSTSEEPMVEMHQPRRMRSVRRAPPPPCQPSTPLKMPDAPAFNPELHPAMEKRRAPVPPAGQVGQPWQQGGQAAAVVGQPPHQKAGEPPYRPPGYGRPVASQPPPYQQLYQPAPAPQHQPFGRADPLRVSSEFTAQLNQAMAGRRVPSESDL